MSGVLRNYGVLPFRVLGLARRQRAQEVEDGRWDPQTRRHQELLQFIEGSGMAPSSRILDVGCGKGLLASRLMRAGFGQISGCDWLPPPGAASYPYRQVDLNREGLTAYADRSFDVVIASDVLEHLENPASMLRECARVLRPGGHVVITIPNCWNIFERIHFLLTGNSSRYRSERKSGPHGHISMLPSGILESLADRAGLRLDRMAGGCTYFLGHFWGNLSHPLLSYNLMYSFSPKGEGTAE